jgi:hypothetical protein
MKEFIKAGETRQTDGVIQAAREAGRQLVKEGRISEEILGDVSRPLISQEVYYKAAAEQLSQAKESLKNRQ